MILNKLHMFLKLNREYVIIKNYLSSSYHIDQLPISLCNFNKENFIRTDENIIYADGNTSRWYICCYHGINNDIDMIEPLTLNKIIYEYYKSYIDKLSLNND